MLSALEQLQQDYSKK
ncbi:MbeD/MobD family mobilization/exclusion protein, partial [Salmonella enterica]